MALNFLNNGYFAGKVGIGTESPASILEISSTAPVLTLRNPSANPANAGMIRFIESTNTDGFQLTFDGSDNKLKFISDSSGTEVTRMVIQRADGNVGIGTTSPYNKTHINTTVDGDGLLLDYTANNNKYVGVFFKIDTNTSDAYKKGALVWERTGGYNEGRFHFLLNNDDNASNVDLTDSKVTILSTGNVGIGTTSPSGLLHIHQTGSGTNNSIITEDDARKIFIGRDSIKATDLSDNPAELYIQQHGGNATFGNDISLGGNLTLTTNARYLRAEDNAGTTTRLLGINGSNNTYIGPIDTYAGGSIFYGVSANVSSHTLYTGASARLHINSSGNVGIGTTNPGLKLDINSGTANSALRVLSTDRYTGIKFEDDTNNDTLFYDGQSDLMYLGSTNFRAVDLHATGNLRVQGAIYDSNNSPGTANQVLVSTVTGTDWVDGSAIPGVPGGSGTLNTVPLWTPDGDTLGNSPITISGNNATFAGEITATNIYAETYRSSRTDGEIYIQAATASDFVSIGTQAANNLMRIQGNGNVGIGTTSPGGLLHVSSGTSGDAVVIIESDTDNDNENDNPQLQFKQDGGNTIAKIGLSGDAGTIFTNSLANTAYFGNDEAASVQLYTNATARLTIESGGDVGIGTTNPGYKLDVNGSVNTAFGATNGYRINTNRVLSQVSGGVEIGVLDYKTIYPNISFNNDNTFKVQQNGSTRIIVNSSGNVGIGTTSPRTKLEIGGSGSLGAVTNKVISATFDGGYSTTNSLQYNVNAFIGTSIGSTTDIFSSTGSETDKNFYTGLISDNSYFNGSRYSIVQGGAERLTIARGGNVGIGTTSPAKKLEVVSNTTYDGIQISGSSIPTFGIIDTTNNAKFTAYVRDSDATIGMETNHPLTINTNNTERIRVTSSGNVGIGTTSPGKKLEVESSTTPLHLNRTGGATALIGLDIDGTTRGLLGATTTAAFVSYSTTPAPLVTVANAGGVQFNTYSAGTLVTDASGNITVSSGGGAGGPYLPLAGGTMTGNIVLNDNVQLQLGSTADLRIYSNGTDNYINNINGHLNIRNNANDKDIIFQSDNGSGGVTTYLTLDGSNERLQVDAPNGMLFSDNIIAKFGTSADLQIKHNGTDSYIENYTGNLNVVNYADNKDIIFWSDDGAGGITTYFELDGAAGYNKAHKDILYLDNIKARFGNSNDLQIYHDGSNSYIKDNGIGDLRFMASNIKFYDNATAELMAQMIPNGAVELYYNNVKKFETTSTGATVTGQLTVTNGIEMTAGNFNAGDGERIRLGNSADFQIYHSGTHSFIDGSNGQGSLYIRPGNGGTIQLETTTGTDMIVGTSSAVTLYSNGNSKLSTGAVGVGTATTAGGTLIDGWITTTQANAINNTTIATTAYVNNKIALIPAGLRFEGTWDASTGNPPSASPENGQFWIVSVAGSTSLSGITDWKVGDWAIYVVAGAGTDGWQKVDNSSVLDGFGTGQSVTKWDGSGTSNTLTDGPITFSGNNSTFAGDVTINGSHLVLANGTTEAQATDYLYIGGSGFAAADAAIYIGNGGSGDNVGWRLFYEGSGGGNDNKFIIKSENTGTPVDALAFTQDGSATFAGDVTIQSTGVKPLLFTKSTYGDFSTDAFYRIKFQDQGGVTNDVGLGQTATGSLGFNITAGKSFIFNNGTSGQLLSLSGTYAAFSSSKVGIGTTTPTEELTVAGTIMVPSGGGAWGTSSGGVQLNYNSGTSQGHLTTYYDSTSLVLGAGVSQKTGITINGQTNTSGNNIFFRVGNSERMRITSSGNVGIGTTNPGTKLQVGTGSGATVDTAYQIVADGSAISGIQILSGATQSGRLVFGDSGNNDIGIIKYDHSDNSLQTIVNAAERTRITNAGQLLINATSSGYGNNNYGYNLGVKGTASQAFISIARSTQTLDTQGMIVGVDSNTGYLLMRDNLPISFYNNNTFKMRIATNGNVGIGVTGPQSKLQVDGGIQMADDTDTASAAKVGTMRYRTGTEYVEVTGTELITNGDFNTDTAWTKGAGWAIANGKATLTAQGASTSLTSTIMTVTSGSIYKIVVDVVSTSTGFRLYDTLGVVSYGLSVGKNTFYRTVSSTSYQVTPLGLSGASGSIESVSVIEVTSEDASYADMCMQTGSSTYEWVNIVRNTY